MKEYEKLKIRAAFRFTNEEGLFNYADAVEIVDF
jgi:hypothetical protein